MHLLRKNYKGVDYKGFRLSVETQAKHIFVINDRIETQAKHILKIMYLLLIIKTISGNKVIGSVV